MKTITERSEKLKGIKCPTCGYQLVAIDNAEEEKLVRQFADKQLRDQAQIFTNALTQIASIESFGDASLIAKAALAKALHRAHPGAKLNGG